MREKKMLNIRYLLYFCGTLLLAIGVPRALANSEGFSWGFGAKASSTPDTRELNIAIERLLQASRARPFITKANFLAKPAKGRIDPYARERALLQLFNPGALPSEFQVWEANARESIPTLWQRAIDAAHEVIFSAKNGQLTCEFSHGRADQLQSLFGVSLQTAEKLAPGCRPENRMSPVNAFAGHPIRNYTLLLTPKNDSPISGFTKRDNHTLLIIEVQHMGAAEILASLNHEIAIRFDGTYIDKNINYLNFEPHIKTVPGFDFQMYRCAHNHPVVAQTLRARRAFMYEYLAMRELGFQPNNTMFTSQAEGESACKDELDKIFPLIQDSIGKIIPEELRKFEKENPECAPLFDAGKAYQAFHATRFLNTGVRFRYYNGDIHPFRTDPFLVTSCRLLSSPHFVLDSLQNIRIGPRPNSGGGWGNGSRER